MINSPDQQEGWPQWLRAAIFLVIAGSLALVSLIVAGAFDPQPLGDVAAEFVLDQAAVVGGQELLQWPAPEIGDSARNSHTWQLTAAHSNGEIDSGYGLALGDDQRALVVAVSPLGYAAVWERDEQGRHTADWLPWQPWPHVKTAQGLNEIWIDVVPEGAADQVTVRINRELLWSGQVAALAGSAGIWASSVGNNATIDFQRLVRYDDGSVPSDGRQPR